MNTRLNSSDPCKQTQRRSESNSDAWVKYHPSVLCFTKVKAAARQQQRSVVMTGRRIGAAASRGRGRTGLNKEATAGSKRKAQEVLCIEHNSGSTTPRQAAAQSQSQQTIKSVRLSFQQEVRFAIQQEGNWLQPIPHLLQIVRCVNHALLG